jgi:type IV secretion system protein VirB6
MTCPALRLSDTSGFATALDMIDCRSGQAIATAFSRLFGAQGALLPALTILLTLYVAIFAIGLLTGRSRLGISALTPRMLTLGMALTFATSWAAYQNVVWTLAAGAPDQIATLMTGSHGSATSLFARGLDRVFRAIAAVAQEQQAHPPADLAKSGTSWAEPGMPSGSTLLWLSAIILLLSTVGALITAKIALAGLVAIGPLFVVLALFRSTWGLFEGWLKSLVLLMLVPLFVVLIGGGALAMIMPMIGSALGGHDDDVMRAAIMLFLAACIYCALIAMVIKMAATIVGGWRLPIGSSARAMDRHQEMRAGPAAQAPARRAEPRNPPPMLDDRVRAMVSAVPSPAPVDRRLATITNTVTRLEQAAPSQPAAATAASPQRALAIGRRFRAPVHVVDKDRLT